jgi:hypothetical protein
MRRAIAAPNTNMRGAKHAMTANFLESRTWRYATIFIDSMMIASSDDMSIMP